MNQTTIRGARYFALLQTASLFALGTAPPVQAQQTAQATMPPEQVLVTGSLIHGAAAVGVPVASFNQQDFQDTGALTTADLFKDVPSVVTYPSYTAIDSGGTTSSNQNINIHNLSANNGGGRTLLLIDGIRYPGESVSACMIDPSIIPVLAVERLDLLADGASATYGSDAIAGVVNVILRRGFDGAITQAQFGDSTDFPSPEYRFSQLFGRKWDSGDVAITFETTDQRHVDAKNLPRWTQDFSAIAGLDNRLLLVNSDPATLSVGSAKLASTAAGQNPTTAAYTAATLPGTPGAFTATMGTSCGNCYAVPSQNGVGLTWAAILANTPAGPNGTTLGTANERNSWENAWALPQQQRNSLTATFDQNLFPNVQLFADAFYSNRRSQAITSTGSSAPFQTNDMQVSVPTSNPYYPVGAPTNLIVYYSIALETPVNVAANEVDGRYDAGFNIDLPYNWLGKIYASRSESSLAQVITGEVNPGAVSAALGWTIPAAAGGASYAKPAGVPYLNLFCDPTHFTCNSPATLAYLQGYRNYYQHNIYGEVGATFDGPVFSLPGGDVKGAVGALYNDYNFNIEDRENYNNQSTALITDASAPIKRNVWASFAQLNIPVFGNGFTLPLVESLNIEASFRYDDYSDFGSTTNPKVSATWGVIDGLQFKGAWGTAFRAPSPANVQAVSGGLLQPVNTAAGAASNTVGTCPVVGQAAVPGSPAAALDPNCTAALQSLGGITLSGGEQIASAVRSADFNLQPEKAQNLSAGIEWAPTDDIFKGLDIEATYYFVRIRGKLQGCASQGLDSPLSATCFLYPGNDPNFQQQVLALLGNPRSQLPLGQNPNSISYIFDGAIRNIGWQSVNGVDFNGSYSFDAGDFGAWNAGVSGNYIIDNKSVTEPGLPVVSMFSTPVNGTANSGGRLRYRARLGWNGGPDDAWGITGFMNFFSHQNNLGMGTTGQPLAPLCFLQGEPACNASGMPQYAQYTMQYPTLNNLVPGLYTFDLQLSYRTKEVPANDYLKNIDVTLMVSDLFDKATPFQYVTGNPARGAAAGTTGGIISIQQRVILLTVTKSW